MKTLHSLINDLIEYVKKSYIIYKRKMQLMTYQIMSILAFITEWARISMIYKNKIFHYGFL